MSDHSLMNPIFLKKELSDQTEMLAKDETLVREMQIDIDRVLGYFLAEDLKGIADDDSITLSREQVKDIIWLLGGINANAYRITSPRKVIISQLKQLLRDRRWLIASRFGFLKK